MDSARVAPTASGGWSLLAPLVRAATAPPGSSALLALVAASTAVLALADGLALSHANGFGADFRGTIWTPDRAILHGISPYPRSAVDGATPPAIYLPPIYLATLPIGLLPAQVATWLWLACLLAAVVGSLAVLGVRDRWCYAFVVLSLPVEQALVLGNASILLALGCAVAWRCRDRPIGGALAVAASVALKFWLWPLLAWLLMIRRRTGIRAVLASCGLTVAAWAAIGFAGLRAYPSLMASEAHAFAADGVFLVGRLVQLGTPLGVASATGLFVGLALLLVAWRERTDELRAYALALLAALVATPVGWLHYLVLLALSVAVRRPRMTIEWAWLPALWLALSIGLVTSGAAGATLALSLWALVPVIAVYQGGSPSGRRTTVAA